MRAIQQGFLWVAVLLLVACGGEDGTGTGQLAGTGNATAGIGGDGVEQPGTTGDDGASSTDVGSPDSDEIDDPTTVDPDDTELRITSVEPAVGDAKGGDVVTVYGNAFVDGEIQIFFGASQGYDIFVLSSTRLTCTTPPGNPGLVDVTLSNPEQETTAQLENAFRYQSDMLIIGMDPDVGNVLGGEPVTISGSGFSHGETTVLFGQRKAIGVQVVDDGTIHLTTPAGDGPGYVDVHVSNEQGTAAFKGGFLYYEAPAIDAVLPGAGPTEGGTEVTLLGRGFEVDSTVRFGEGEATKLTFVSATELLAVTPAAASAGVVSVTVETQYGYGGLADGFHYVDAAPDSGVSVIGVQPGHGSTEGGETVYVTAYGLTTAEDTVITFDDTAAEIVSVDSTQLVAVVMTPAHSEAVVDVSVATSEGSDTLAGAYSYVEVLSVTAVNPYSGPTEGGTAVSIYGQGFAEGMDVRVGALPCANVVVVNDKTIECTTPPGSPGGADVAVFWGGETANLADGFFYQSGTAELFVVDPEVGSQAGGTYVRLLGAGFEAPAKVTFDGASASHVKVVSSTLITAKTPPGEVGTADVSVESGGTTSTLADGFTYFDPVALFGGTWGPDVEGSVNVTVLDGGNGDPLPDVFVMLYVDPDTPYQGFTNNQGQITFSGPDVLGQQMVSASKEGYASASVIEFNATNITIYLIPTPPPSMGPPPPGATISGTVHGLGKYVVVPPGNCASKFASPGQECAVCTTDEDCTAFATQCTNIADTGSFCTQGCLADSDCNTGYTCLNVGGIDEPQCVPSPGQKQARCYFTMGAKLPDSQDPFIVAEDGTFTIPSALGEVAVVCLGGVVAWGNPDNETNFTAYAFGVKRHVFVAPGANDVGQVTLNHPLKRTIKVRLDDAPYDPVIGPNVQIVQVYWDFGSDGIFFHRNFFAGQYMYSGNTNFVHEIERQPSAWSGDVYDARFMVLAGAVTVDAQNPNSQEPSSLTVLRDLKDIETDAVYELEAGQWDAVAAGVTHTVYDLHGFGDDDIWGVGANGAILHQSALGWGLQASPTEEDLYGVWGPADDDVWAVGANGTVLRFDGATWFEDSFPSSNWDIRAIWGRSSTDIYVALASYGGIYHYDGTAWSKMSSTGADLRDVHGFEDTVFAVGRYGAIRSWSNGTWVTQVASDNANKDLNGVHVVSATEAYAVGDGGRILAWDGTGWTSMPSPTTRTLRAVWAVGPMDVYAVGDGSTVMHFDGLEWVDQTLAAKVSYNALLALWGNPMTARGVALGTSEMLMGPMLEVPEGQNPADGGVMGDYFVSFEVKPGVPAHYNLLNVFIPTPFGETPVWTITTDGDVFDFDLPDFANIEGTPGIAGGGFYGLRIMRGYKNDFTIDNFDNYDFNPQSWSLDTTYFTK